MIRRWSAIMWEFHMTLWPFLARALEAGHPKDWKGMLTLQCMRCSWTIFHRPPYLLACRRIDSIKKYTQLAQASKAEELKLRLKMPARIRKLMTGKRVCLLGTMLADLVFLDYDLLHDLCNGFNFSGWMPDSRAGHLPCASRWATLMRELLNLNNV